MRDLVLREGLKTMAGDASLRLRERLAAGIEVPYEVREAGSGSALAEYVPQTSRFIRDAADELKDLDSFGTTCAALEAAGLAGAYLEEMGVPVPSEASRRAELAGIVFCCRLWHGSTDFTLDDVKLAAAVDEVVDLGEAALGEVEIAAPLRGFHMDVERLELAGATIVRSDTVEVPAEARAAEGMGGAGWEATFLVVARVDALGATEEGSDLGLAAVEAFRRVVTTLRLFKPGGVALGPHAWVKSGGDRWRRILTGAGRPRPGGYRLADTELGDVAALSRGLAAKGTPFARAVEGAAGFPSTLSRAISRFEAGLERSVTLEALNDYLLTLRFLLEGGGPASLGMPMRVSALCADPDTRTEVKETVDRAIALERELWSGEPALGLQSRPPAEVAAEIEELTRAILADAACGHLGNELRITADEILLGEGLSIGEGAGAADRGETAEWGSPDEAPPLEDDAAAFDAGSTPEEEPLEEELENAMSGGEPTGLAADGTPETEEEPMDAPAQAGPARAQNLLHELMARDEDFEWSEPAPRAERDQDREPLPVTGGPDDGAAEAVREAEDELPDNVRVLRPAAGEGPVAALIADSEDHRREVHNRVSFLFPRPETTEWSVSEVAYDRTRRSRDERQD